MTCGKSCGDGNVLAAGEIRPSKDTSITLPLKLSENKRPENVC